MTPTRAARVSSLRSMTGFGRAEVSAGPVAISVEARSLNHRHLDVTLRLPRALADLEMDARRLIQSRLERGRVEIAAQLSPAPDTPGQKISVDQALAAQSAARARALGSAIGTGGGGAPPRGAVGPPRRGGDPGGGARACPGEGRPAPEGGGGGAGRPAPEPPRAPPGADRFGRGARTRRGRTARGAAARADPRAPRRGADRPGADPRRGGDLGGEDRRARGAHPAPRAPRAVRARARRGRGRGSAARLPEPGAEPRGQHDRLEGPRPRGQSGGARSEGPDREDARAGAKS